MNRYICKCGKVIYKSTNAENTGNRDTAGCEGCPYLLPWGSNEYVEGQGFVKDIQGYECRMSPSIDYASTYYGSADDKCTLRIISLDLDFLEEIQAWIERYAGGQLYGEFSRKNIRGTDYSDKGRYSWSISCAQNKKGMAAKAALIQRFFDSDRHRLDMTPEQEKAHIRAVIEKGKATALKTENKEEQMESTESHGIITETGELLENGSECRRRAASRARAGGGKVQAIHICDEQPQGIKIWLNAFCPAEYWVLSQSEKIESEHIDTCPYCKADLKNGCGDVLLVPFGKEPESNNLPKILEKPALPDCSCGGCTREDCTCAGMKDALGRAGCDGEEHCKQSGCTYAIKHRANPTSSAAVTAAAEETVAAPEMPDLASMTVAPAVKTNEPRDAATESALAGGDGSTAFDYSGLDDQTVADLHLAEREYSSGKKMAEMGLRRMSDAVAIAHDVLVANCEGHNQHSEDTFSAWCRSIGLKKDSAYRMLQVSKLMDNSTPREQKVLEELSPSLLYAAAKPSAPAELVQMVKDKDITTHKQFKELEARLKATEQKLAEERQAHQAEQKATSALLAEEQRRRQQANEERIVAQDQAQRHKEMKDAAIETLKGEREAAAQKIKRQAEIIAMREKELAEESDRADAAEQRAAELENRPVEVAIQEPDPSEVKRLANEKAAEMTAMYKAQISALQEQVDDAERRAQAGQDNAYMAAADFALQAAATIHSIRSAFWALAKELSAEDFSAALEPIDQAVQTICERDWECDELEDEDNAN